MFANHRTSTLHRFFSGLTESAFFGRLGVADPPLIDYLAELLVRFVHISAIHKVRNLTGRRLEEVAEMLVEADERIGNSRREVHRHIGDFTLFWTGIYPEALKRKQSDVKKDRFLDYCAQGKRSYYIASTYRDSDNARQSEVLERISDQFELCSYGLSQVRRGWQRQDEEGEAPGPLLFE